MFYEFLVCLHNEVAYQRDVTRSRIPAEMTRREWRRSAFLWSHPLPPEVVRGYRVARGLEG